MWPARASDPSAHPSCLLGKDGGDFGGAKEASESASSVFKTPEAWFSSDPSLLTHTSAQSGALLCCVTACPHSSLGKTPHICLLWGLVAFASESGLVSVT